MSRVKLGFVDVLVLVAVVGGFVGLTLAGEDTTGYLALTGPMMAAVLVGTGVRARVDERSDAQDETLAEIGHNVNGRLTERLRKEVPAAVEAVLLRHGLIGDRPEPPESDKAPLSPDRPGDHP